MADKLEQRDTIKRKQAEIESAWEAHTDSSTPTMNIHADWREIHLSSQKMLCAYCSIKLTKSKDQGVEDRQATLDHIIPLSKGGPETFENTNAACAYCNLHKGSLSAAEYRKGYDFLYRIKEARVGPNKCSNDPKSPHYDSDALERGIGIQFNGQERTDVSEYSVSDGWIKIPAGKSVDRRGNRLLFKLKGHVYAYYIDIS